MPTARVFGKSARNWLDDVLGIFPQSGLTLDMLRVVPAEEFWLTDDGEAYEGAADQDLVGQGVDNAAEFAGDIVAASDHTVGGVGDGGNEKEDKGAGQ